MVYKRYYSPFEGNSANSYLARNSIHEKKSELLAEEKLPIHSEKKNSPLNFLNKIGYDDLILIGVIIILLMEDKENRDIPLILALGFLFLIQYIEAD